MLNKLLFRTFILALMMCLMIWDILQYISHSGQQWPEQHRELLAMGALLWIVSIFILSVKTAMMMTGPGSIENAVLV